MALRAGDRIRRSALGPDGVRWRDWEVVGWAVRDPEGRYLTSLRRYDLVERQTILFQEEPTRTQCQYLRRSGFRAVRVVRRVRDVATEPLRASECRGCEAGACHRPWWGDLALECVGRVEPSGPAVCSRERRWRLFSLDRGSVEIEPRCLGADAVGWRRGEGW